MARAKSVEKKKPPRVAAGPEAAGFARSLGENTGRVVRPFVPLALILAVLAGASFLLWTSFGKKASAGGIGGESAQHLTAPVIRQAILSKPRPAWIRKEDFEQIANLGVTAAAGRSVFEANLSRSLAEAYSASSWVEEVRAVRLRCPAQIEVDIDWRKPVARIDRPSMVLDRNGVVLNLMADSAAARDTPLISGVAPVFTPAGKKVQERDTLDALTLLAAVKDALNGSPGSLKVANVLREPSGTWRVTTDRGPYIFWGHFTDDPPEHEPRTRDKVELLRRRLCEMKDPALFEYVRVYTDQAPVKPRAVVPAVTQSSGTRPRSQR